MQEDKKCAQFEKFVLKLKQIAKKAIEKGKYECAMAAISAAGRMNYQFNQVYTDSELEEMIKRIAQNKLSDYGPVLANYKTEKNTVLFYDGFGLDTRGVAIMYLNALKKIGYKIIYVTDSRANGTLHEITQQMQDADIVWEYISMKESYTIWVEELMRVILRHTPKAMLFYTKPNDVAGAVSFCMLDGLADRFLIDLTDHAFWLGTCCNDYFCGSREMSASNQLYKRKIPKEKLIKLGVNLIVDEGDNHSGLPFDVTEARYIFSGGSLYKTLGDPENTFYKIVDHLLQNHPDVKFLYAGAGDESQMRLILEKYPEQAYLIAERKDFYYLIKHCTLYLNTYPMFGGMMMKFSANAGHIPVTLRHNADSDGLLINQKAARIEYDSYEELIEDVDKLLSDDVYLKQREALLKGTVISEERFINNLRNTIENHCTDYQHDFIELDTTEFQKEFLERFDLNVEKEEITKKINRSLFTCMPWMYVMAVKKIVKRIKNKMEK